MIDEDRAVRAFTDVLAVEWDEDAGVANIVTLSDSYMAVPEHGQHNCPDREYHDVDMCKHLVALEAVRGRIDVPEGWLTVTSLDERPDAAQTDGGSRQVATDGGCTCDLCMGDTGPGCYNSKLDA